jgi:two-component system response regulator ChvI
MTNQTNTSNPASTASDTAPLSTPRARLLLVDDDALFRESLGLNLIDEGFAVTSVGSGAEALEFYDQGGEVDVLLLDWRMPEVDGLEVLRRLRRRSVTTPVVFLTALSDDIYEEAALEGGAVDFIDKSRRLSILLRRLELILEARRNPMEQTRTGEVNFGRLTLRHEVSRVLWDGKELDLTLTEFNIVVLLAGRAEADVPYREIYDLVHGKDFVAGTGAEGFRANVRTFIKRIRKKFRSVDPTFDHIQNYAGFGYRWTAGV